MRPTTNVVLITCIFTIVIVPCVQGLPDKDLKCGVKCLLTMTEVVTTTPLWNSRIWMHIYETQMHFTVWLVFTNKSYRIWSCMNDQLSINDTVYFLRLGCHPGLFVEVPASRMRRTVQFIAFQPNGSDRSTISVKSIGASTPNMSDETSANTLRPRQNGRRFADDVFKCIFFNENVSISNTIWLKFVPKCLVNNIPSLVHILAWRRPGVKPLSESMMVSLLIKFR